ncbi:hypothetical protein Kpol_1010p21 [Vanderwaltozyma polyspora DSM 70294]|uniref:Guanine nucleotide-binding protein subunit gamma n=1 Tax=Vanderwaltozyma polyspora (strain ATCC 22028 / DSM 70294 / BCRC 21397 / CBS 2163 / NBRC 10782 / NRRL Y-8283 / UCD 57-17) TaxID=436907 RepID=A7TIG8_VANPO|nr:uncharacterized protein Kpol_1010p21 [Vanderwaltozyma polyspora DSM 70294]EDO17906.1 hypothetical protein Kpol_1010p21 [Vanderwaltozyma polyspora DSM 70294]
MSDIQLAQQDPVSLKIKYLKLKRINELNNKLKNELARERITASNASLSIINYTSQQKDYVISDVWGYPEPGTNHFRNTLTKRVNRNQQNKSADNNACCTIM